MVRLRLWLEGRSPRERWLLAVMIALLAVAIFWAAVLRPVTLAQSRAAQRLDAAALDLGRVAAAEAKIRALRSAPPVILPMPLDMFVRQAGEAAGFVPSRLDLQGTDRVMLSLPSAKSPALFTWLGELERQGVIVEQLTLRPGSDATVSVEATLRARGR